MVGSATRSGSDQKGSDPELYRYQYSEQCFINKKCFTLYRKASQIVQQNEGMMKGEADMARCLLCPTRLGLRLQENIATGGGGERGERGEEGGKEECGCWV